MDPYANYWSVGTTLFYLAIMLWGMLFSNISSMKRSTNKGNLSLMLAFLPMFLTLILRDISRGNDSVVYFDMFNNLQISSLGDAFSAYYFLSREPLYGLSELFLTLFTSSLNEGTLLVLYFAMQTILWSSFMFLALREEKSRIGLALPFAVMFGVCFPLSFNIIRNLIAVSIMLYAYTQLAQEKEKNFFILNIIAIGFHYTAVFCLLSYFVIYSKNKFLKYGAILGTIIFILFGASILTNIFGGLDSRYSEMGANAESFGFGLLAKRFPFLMLVLVFRKRLIAINPHNKLYINLLLFDLLISQASYVNPMFNRIALYFSAIKIFIIPSFYILLKQRIGVAAAKVLFFIILLIWLYFAFNEYVVTNPYFFMPYFSPYLNVS